MHWRSLMVVINLDPYPSPRPRFTRQGRPYMPKEYTAWKKKFLKEWLTYGLDKFDAGVAIAVDLKFYIKPPKAIARVKKNQNILKAETWRVVKKPDLDNLEKSVLDSVNGHAYEDDNQISDLHSCKRYSLNPRVEISIKEDGSYQDEISSVRMTKSDVEVLKGATNIVDFWNACTEFYSDEELAWAWLHPELVEQK